MNKSVLRPTRAAIARAFLTLALAGGLGIGVTGCGFTPLYATPGVSPALESVSVETPLTRTGYLLKQQLNDQLARDTDLPARYHLITTFDEHRYPRGTVTGRVLLQGKVPVEVSYDSSTPPYAGTAANQDGEVRVAAQAAIGLRLALSRYFQAQAEPPASGAASPASDSKPIALPSLRNKDSDPIDPFSPH